jgi:hypothetical protein
MLSVAVIFFTFATGAFVIGVYLLGIGADEPEGGGKGPLYTIGWIELVVGLFLVTQVLILVEVAGLPTLAGVVGLFALFFISFGIALINGADLRPVGAIAFTIGLFAWPYAFFDGFDGVLAFQSNAILWSIAFFAIAAFTYGKFNPKLLGGILMLVAIWGWLPAVYLSVNATIF